MFNLNRETHDTTAFNSWNRRNYITSSPSNPTVGILIPPTHNEWRRNLVLGRDFYDIADGNGNAIRNDDGASFYTHSNNVLWAPGNPGVQFNGGTEIHTRGNLFIQTKAGWNLGPTPDAASVNNDTLVDNPDGLFSGNCEGFLNAKRKGVPPGIYTGDWNYAVTNSTGRPPPGPPPPPAPPPSPPWPKLGLCSVPVAGYSLAEESGAKQVAKTDSATACGVMCKGNCTGYTWHDTTVVGYEKDCYLTWDPKAWAHGHRISTGHHAAICNNGGGKPPAPTLAPHATSGDASGFICSRPLAEWQNETKGQDLHSHSCTNANGECGSAMWLRRAREMLWAGQ